MFQSILARLVARTGARWAMIVGNDGVLLETDKHAFRSRAESLAAEYAAYMRASRRVIGDTDMGGLNRSLLDTGQGKLLIQALTNEYFLVLCLEPAAFAGKAFFEATSAAGPLGQELRY